MGQKLFLDLPDGLSEIDRRVRVLSLSDADLAEARKARASPMFEQSDYWLKVIDNELLRRELFP